LRRKLAAQQGSSLKLPPSELVVAQALRTTLPEFLADPAAPRDLLEFLERIRDPEILRAYERAARATRSENSLLSSGVEIDEEMDREQHEDHDVDALNDSMTADRSAQ